MTRWRNVAVSVRTVEPGDHMHVQVEGGVSFVEAHMHGLLFVDRNGYEMFVPSGLVEYRPEPEDTAFNPHEAVEDV